MTAAVKAARTLKHYVDGILRWLRHRITNACIESLNSKIEGEIEIDWGPPNLGRAGFSAT